MQQASVMITGLLSVALLWGIPAVAASTDYRAAILANPCAGCHGTDGNSAGAIPSLADKDAKHIRETLLKFKNDQQTGSVMNRIAKGYTDEEIELIAGYFASRKK